MKLATYRYSYAVARFPVLQLSRFTLRVEVLDEKKNRYKVRFMQFHADGRKPNTVAWVKKSSVELDKVEPAPTIEIRLPYKDD